MVKILIRKDGQGALTVTAQRTRRWERKTATLKGIPQEQVGDAVEELVKENRADRPSRRPVPSS